MIHLHHQYAIPYPNHFIAINTFVNNIFRGILLTLPSVITEEGFVVSSSTEPFGPELIAERLAEVSGSLENLPPAFAEAASRRRVTPLLRQAQDGESRRTICQREEFLLF